MVLGTRSMVCIFRCMDYVSREAIRLYETVQRIHDEDKTGKKP
jgi:hypothetical protein